MKLALALIAIAIAVLAYTSAIPAFHEPVDGKSWDADVLDGDSAKYHAARAEAVTAKYKMQDCGYMLFVFGIVAAIYARFKGFPAPTSRLGVLTVTLAAPVVTAVTSVVDLIQGMDRREFPPWADSIGIPLMGVTVIFAVSLLWSIVHVAIFLRSRRHAPVKLSVVAIRFGNKWLLFVSLLTAMLVVAFVAEVAVLLVVPGLVWLYFYASLAALRHDA